MKKMILTSSVAFLLLAACSLSPVYKRPDVTMTDKWKYGVTAKDEQIATDWWKEYKSTELNTMVEWALARNNDVRAAVDRIRESRASAKIANASLFPSADASAGASRSKSDPPHRQASTSTGWSGGIDISYELDLFGANRANREAAAASVNASQFDHDALVLTVTGDTARDYFNVLNLREQVRIAKDSLNITQEVMDIINARYKAGAVSGLEVAQQKQTVEQAQASLAALTQQEEQAENALAIIEGFAPQDLAVSARSLKRLSMPAVTPALPSALLTRRPDIRAAEERLIAANADIGAARAAFFPSVDLSGGASLAASPFSAAATKSLSLAASLAAPIFKGGALTGKLELSKAQKDELVETYSKTVLTAMQEVEDALSAQKAAALRLVSLKAAQAHAQSAYEISLAQYKAGAADFQTLLNAQRDLLSARNSFVGAQYSVFSASVDLFLALGGGWQESR